jgi:GLPGLI family protein
MLEYIIFERNYKEMQTYQTRTILLTVIILLLVTPCGYTQLFPVYPEKQIDDARLIVTYTLSFQLDSLDQRKRKEEMTLLIGEKSSSFYSEANDVFLKASKKFSTIAEMQAFVNDPSIGFRNPRFLYVIFKNHPDGKITTQEFIPSDYYLYTENVKLFEWFISSETSSICGYPAQKATTAFAGREWIAWFTTEIPFNEGPYKFNGLPGLIVKIHDIRNHYLFEMTQIKVPDEPTPINYIERHYIKTTKEGFAGAWNSFRNDFIARSSQFGLDGQSQSVMAGNLQRHNNPLELVVR